MLRILPSIFLFISVACATVMGTESESAHPAKNVIFFISDGCGSATFGLARDYQRMMTGEEALFLDAHQKGSVITRPANGRVTDSAASATAYACAIKTNNGVIAKDARLMSVETILELAEAEGYNTGIISTARVTHATPAAFSSHVDVRNMEAEIASQQIRQGIEIILGGGSMYYLPVQDGGVRQDGLNLIERAVRDGYQAISNREEMLAAGQMPLLGLFTFSHMAFEIDRDEQEEPSLAEMTRKALELLYGDDKPFFIMIEAARIDHSGHGNDAAAHLWGTFAYDEAFKVALDFADEDGETLVVGTSDHESGGLVLGGELNGQRGSGYAYDPTKLTGINSSIESFLMKLRRESAEGRNLDRDAVLADLERLFLLPARSVATEITTMLSEWEALGDSVIVPRLHRFIAQETSRPARLSWATTGHTAVNVPIFAYGPGSDLFTGVLDNTRVGSALREAMGLE